MAYPQKTIGQVLICLLNLVYSKLTDLSSTACETMRMEDKQARVVQEDDENTRRLTGSSNLKTNHATEPMNGRTDLFQVGNLHMGPTKKIVKYCTQVHVHGPWP